MSTYFNFTFMDRSAEKSVASFIVDPVGATGTNWADLLAHLSAVQSALDAVTKGVIMERTIVGLRARLTNAVPSDGAREQKWLIRYESTTDHKVYTWEVPCADETALPFLYASDFVDLNQRLTHTELGALMDALENSLMATPGSGNPVIISIELVGRNI